MTPTLRQIDKCEIDKYETRVTAMALVCKGDPLFSERATHAKIDDEAGGEFVVLSQCSDELGEQKISIDPEEWPALRAMLDRLFKECRA